MKVKNLAMENFHTLGRIGNILSRGDQQILEPVDEVENVQAIAYDRKRQVVVKRKSRKRKLTLDSVVVVTIEETLFDTKKAKVSEFLY
jgi:hypothetical protein